MFFSKKKCCAKKYAIAVAGFCLSLLAGCSDNNHKGTSSSSLSSSSLSSSSAPSTSVSSFSSSSSSVSKSPYIGQWYAPAYGDVVSVSAEGEIFTLKTYSVTQNYCLLENLISNLTLDDIKELAAYSNITKEMLIVSNGYYSPGVEYEKVEQLPAVCEENLQKLKTDSGYTFDAKKDFEIFWQTFNEFYINFELRGLNWSEAYEEAIKSIDDIKDEEELFEFLSELIAPLGDRHVALLRTPLTQNLGDSLAAALANDQTPIFSTSRKLTLYEKLINEYVQTLEPDRELTAAQMEAAKNYYFTNYVEIIDIIFNYVDENSDIETRINGDIFWFKTNDNIGYIGIHTMDSDLAITEPIFNEALKDLGDTEGLIIDVRINDGGQDETSIALIRHFMTAPQVMYSKFAGSGAWATPVKEVVLDPQSDNIYLKPTAVLVSGDTVSAAELFTLAMASLPQVAIIGEPTAGALSDILFKRLTSDILFGISNETYLDAQGNNYEGIGIPVDIAVPFGTLQERIGGYDGGVDTAIEWIKSAP